jgi:uncharacterized membrane protein YhaH (DUF805 family)
MQLGVRYSAQQRRWTARLVLVGAAIVPWIAGTLVGLVYLPIFVLDLPLLEAYVRIGQHNLQVATATSLVTAVLLIPMIALGWRLLHSRRRSDHEYPYSPWRTVRLASAIVFGALVLADIAPAILSIHLGVLEPSMYGSEPLFGGLVNGALAIYPWLALAASLTLLALGREKRHQTKGSDARIGDT